MQEILEFYKIEMEKFSPGFNSLSESEQDTFKKKNAKILNRHFTILTQEVWFNNPLSLEDYFKLNDLEAKLNLVYEELEDKYELEGEQLFKFNKLSTLIKGVGNTYLRICESFDFGKNELTFNTLYDYDLDDFIYQERAVKEFDEAAVKQSDNFYAKQYELKLHSEWMRGVFTPDKTPNLKLEGFYYLTCSSMATYINCEVEDVYYSIIDELVPHTYPEAPEDFDTEMDVFEVKVDAHGKEALYEELSSKARDLLINYSYKLNDVLKGFPEDKIWVIEKNEEATDPKIDLVFSNVNTLKRTRLKHFQTDVDTLGTSDVDDLKALIALHVGAYRQEVIALHQELIVKEDKARTKPD